MREKRKPKIKDLSPLCSAVRRVRTALGWSQERMAQETGIATQTISRFELGKQVPRDYKVLVQLRWAAVDAGLAAEQKLFDDAREKLGAPPRTVEPWNSKNYRPHEWRLMQAARIAVNFFPDTIPATEKALAPALEIVDEILAAADPRNISFGPLFYEDLERQLLARAAERGLNMMQVLKIFQKAEGRE